MNGNLSSTIGLTLSSLSSKVPSTITSAPSVLPAASNVTCPQCQVIARFGPLSVALWWDKTLNLTLDTISVLVTQYNNTAVTRTTTIYQDVSSLNISTMTEAQSLAFSVLEPIDPEYEANGFALNNGTNAFVDGSFSVAYPTPFVGIQGFEYISVTKQDPQCPKGLQSGQFDDNTDNSCVCMMQSYMDNPDSLRFATTSQITLSSTYYELGNTHPVGNDLGSPMEGPIQINNVSYSNFIESVLGSEGFNKYRSCAFLAAGVGPPALMIPVAALTGTTTATVKSAGNYGQPSPKPGSPIAPIGPPQTTTPAAPALVPVVEPKPEKKPQPESSTKAVMAPPNPTPDAIPLVPIVNSPNPGKISPSTPNPAITPAGNSDTGQANGNAIQPAVGSSSGSKNGESNAGAQPVAGLPSDNGNGEDVNKGDTNPIPEAAVAISYAGSSIYPDTSSYYNVPQVGRLSPGGSPVTTNNVVYSLAPSANALVSNGQRIALTTFAAAVPNANKQAAAVALTFGGATYTADSSSNIVVAGQTVVPGAPAIVVSSTPISIAPGVNVAVVGGTTQSLSPVQPTNYPKMTFAGETYTANSDSAIIIQGQTLAPGSSAITILGTPISLAPGASLAVIAGQTQSLSPATVSSRPVLTLGASTYTANAASAFVIAGQTLSPGGILTVSGTPISLAPSASVAVIAGSTQPLALTPAPTEPPTFTFNGSTYTASPASAFVIGGQTLTEGGVVTVAGTPISYGSNGADVVVGTSTEAVNIGGLIMSGFGNGGASTTGPVLFTGGAPGRIELLWWLVGAPLGAIVLLGVR